MNICSGDIVENMRNNICKSQNMPQKDLSAKIGICSDANTQYNVKSMRK